MEVCVVRGTPPLTPLRKPRRILLASPRAASSHRRSLFREESDLSDISPLSPSSDDKTPKKKSPRFKDTTPLKGMRCISTLSLDSPVIRVHSDGSKIRGIRAINRENVGSIPPNLFYGSQSDPRPPPTWIRKDVSKAKTRLFLDDLPRDRKRARTSSGQKIQPASKRPRRSISSHSSRTPLTPIPMLGQNRPTPKPKKKSPNQKSKSGQKFKSDTSENVEPLNGENIENNLTKDFVTTEKDVEDLVGKEIIKKAKKRDGEKMKGNWEVSFTKESRLNECSSPSTNSSRKFFKSQVVNTTPKMLRRASTALTPPWSSHKINPMRRRTLCRPNYVYSPAKSSPAKSTSARSTPTKSSPCKSPSKKQKQLAGLINSISKDISEMMEDESNVDTKDEVTKLIQQLNQNDCTNDWAAALPSPEEEEQLEQEESKTPTKKDIMFSPKKKEIGNYESNLFPIFRSSNKILQTGTSVPSPVKSKKKSRRYFGFGEDQYQIDSGQDSLKETQCNHCGLFYSKGCPEDEIIHIKHHSHGSLFSYSGWKNERVVGRKGEDKVISILKDDPKSWWNKAKAIVQFVDSQLGFPQISLDSLKGPQVYLYIRDGKDVAGCLVAEQISHGFQLLSLEQDVDLCSEESYPAKCGVSRIWVHPNHRRSSVSTSLVNSLRASFAYGVILPKEELAFTVPTDDGKKFISQYMGKPTGYLVYM